MLLKEKNKADFIFVSNHIDGYEELESNLQQITEIKLQPTTPAVEQFRIPIVLASLILIAIVYISTNKYLVLASGTVLTLGLIWSVYEVQTSKHVDRKTKRIGWWTIVVILVVISITYSKFVG